jgi:hypothetical protein
LFYLASDDRLMAVSMKAASDGQALESGTPVALFVTRLATGGGTGAGLGVGIGGTKQQYAVAADGRFLMNVVVGEPASSPVTIVLNWQEELKRLVPVN